MSELLNGPNDMPEEGRDYTEPDEGEDIAINFRMRRRELGNGEAILSVIGDPLSVDFVVAVIATGFGVEQQVADAVEEEQSERAEGEAPEA